MVEIVCSRYHRLCYEASSFLGNCVSFVYLQCLIFTLMKILKSTYLLVESFCKGGNSKLTHLDEDWRKVCLTQRMSCTYDPMHARFFSHTQTTMPKSP